uniref:hypothetical protein n=1 Tax=Arctium tomentosum TaxID=4218 RepID=UPI001D0FC4CD|nr:hypothetical protein LK293_mgp078 [Arctium tomentosum]YP_010194947.1 hypothetical protein LK294_mgp079 [Arctium lappa]QZZ81556.1 hypothetical protein [Arctium tomentosum]QZZ81686.1 hypothetical protein [Arctium lappa]
MDGTFNQTKPLDLLVGSRVCFSFDPRSATDRWPIVFLERVVSKLFDQDFSEAVSFLLSGGEFDVPWVTTPGSTVRFLSGYPLGYLGAWPLFALSHHLIIWWCAELVYPGRVFTNYAVLGDDVVIADENVATRYKESLDLLQVVISKEKSLISRSGSAEFTNNFRVRDLTVDLSPYSIKALLNTFHPYGLMAVAHRYSVRDFRLLCRLGGAGYRVLARLDHRRPRRYSRLGVMGLKLLSPSYPLDFWLGKGRPLSPEAHGRLVRLLRAKLQPRELVLPPDELFETEESRDFLEYSLLYGWMRQWLNYLKWYHLTALSPWVTLEELFSGPVVSHSWRMVAVGEDLVRFSLEVVYRSALLKCINQAVK